MSQPPQWGGPPGPPGWGPQQQQQGWGQMPPQGWAPQPPQGPKQRSTAEKLAIVIGLCVSCCVFGVFASGKGPSAPPPSPVPPSAPPEPASVEVPCAPQRVAEFRRRLDDACEQPRRGRGRECPRWRELILSAEPTCRSNGTAAVRVVSTILERNALTEVLARESCSQVNMAAIPLSSEGVVVRYYLADGHNIIANNVFNAGGYCVNGLFR